MTSPIISVIVTFHAEAEVAQLTLLGIERLRRYAEKNGIMVEFVSVLDCANSETILAVRSSSVLRDNDQVIEVNNRDLGASRNSGIQAARGNFIGIFDGDDYYTDNWLVEALKVSKIAAHNLIVHPELQISFGCVHCVSHVLDMDKQPDYPLQNCLAIHPWVACSFGAKSIYEKSPYCRTDTQETGFGFEDWHWNLETIAKGGRHVCASNTAHYYRRKPTSMLTEMLALGAVIRPTEFFDYPERWNVELESNSELFILSKKKKSDILIPQWAIEGFLILSKKKKSDILIPQWAIEGFRQIAEIEPVLYPTKEFLGNFFLYTPPLDLAPGELYAKVFALLGGFTPDIICLVPWLAWGNKIDAEWQKTFSVQASGQKVLVISSNPDDSQLNRQVPQEFRLLEFGELARNHTENQQIQVLTRLILQSTASEIYVIKSPLGWELIKRHSKSFIASNKRIYVSICNSGTDQDPNVIGEQYHTEITPWLHEYAADNNLAQSQITIWEKMAAEYIIRQEPNFCDLPGRRTIPRNYKRDTVACEHIDVSIITPYYNTEAFFVETFVSLQAQSLQNWEWMICDDGSTDQESVNRLAEVAAKDERITVIRQKNAGPSAARNTAFHKAVGRYVCLLDSDDMLEPTYLEKCVWFLDSNPEFAFCNAYSVMFGDQEYLWTTGFERGKAHLQANSGPPISVIRRSAYGDCGGFDESIRFGHEDWDFWLAMANAGHWGYTIPEFLQWYRKRVNGRFEQVMRTGNVNDEFERTMLRKYDGLDKHFPEPYRRHLLPYETIETTALVTNPLAANPSGRRILFAVPWMVMGGADRVNLDLIEGLTSKGHDITVCASLATDHRWEHQFSRFTPDIFVLPNILHASDYPRFLAYLIQSRQIDTVVITGSTIVYHLLPYLRAVSPGVAFVDMNHVEELDWLNGGHPRFGVGYQDALDINIVTTKHLADWMQDRGADGTRIKVMYTGVRSAQATQLSEVREQMRAELKISANVPVIVFAGRICEQKRPAMLAKILKAAYDQGLIFQALVIGDGELRGQFEALLSQYHLTANVQMLGSVSHQRWLDILVASDILLMPSEYEGISIALLEAMAAGVVPVVAKVGGQGEIVSSDAGVLIPHEVSELQEYLDAIRHLLSNSSKLQQMSKRCKAIATSKLSWEGMIDKFLTILDEAHQLRVNQPRYPISPNFGRELASLSLEYKRLGEAVDWIWNTTPLSASTNALLMTSSAEAQAIAKFAILLSQTRFIRIIFRSRLLRIIGKKLLKIVAS